MGNGDDKAPEATVAAAAAATAAVAITAAWDAAAV
jgi:hypothetical protein